MRTPLGLTNTSFSQISPALIRRLYSTTDNKTVPYKSQQNKIDIKALLDFALSDVNESNVAGMFVVWVTVVCCVLLSPFAGLENVSAYSKKKMTPISHPGQHLDLFVVGLRFSFFFLYSQQMTGAPLRAQLF